MSIGIIVLLVLTAPFTLALILGVIAIVGEMVLAIFAPRAYAEHQRQEAAEKEMKLAIKLAKAQRI